MKPLLILATTLCLWGFIFTAIFHAAPIAAVFAIGFMGCFWRLAR